MRRRTLAAALAAVSLFAGACAGADATDLGADAPTSTRPADDDPGPGTDAPAGDTDEDEAREQARSLLGMHEEALPDDVRVARRGDEQFMLTEDYVIGRRTVELDDDGSGYRVMTVTIELADGPETFHLAAS